MAGLVAAAEARRLGARPVVFEKLERAGGSMRLSSGVVWRHREFERFREDCPGGDERLQRLVFARPAQGLAGLPGARPPAGGRPTPPPPPPSRRLSPRPPGPGPSRAPRGGGGGG